MSHLSRVARRLILVVLVGLALAPASAHAAAELAILPAEVDFGANPAGASADRTVTIRNMGPDATALSDVVIEGSGVDQFDFVDGTCLLDEPLTPAAECQITLRFSTASGASGAFEAFLWADGGPEDTSGVARLAGSVLPAGVLSAQPSAIVFPQTPLRSTSAPQLVTVRNSGAGPIAVPTVSMTNGDFKVASNTCPPVLGVAADCTVGVVFAPTASRTAYAGHLVVGPRSSWTRQDGLSVALSGTIGPPLPPTDPMAMIESDLATLSDSIPKALRGGPRKVRLADFTAPAAGTLRVRVHGWSGKGRILFASGERRLAPGERHRLRLTLTKKGRKLLRRPKRSRVKVMVSFTADADGAVSRQSPEYKVKPPKVKRLGKLAPKKRRG